MTDVYIPKPGDIVLTEIGGTMGATISFLQDIVALAPSIYQHAAVVLDKNEVIGAQPAGARIDPIGTILDNKHVAILPVPEWAQDRRAGIVSTARGFEGVPYGFLDYAGFGLSRLHIRPKWLQDFIASDKTMICSALADRAWMLNGIHLFDDGRLLGAVSPGHLATVGWTYHLNTGPYPVSS